MFEAFKRYADFQGRSARPEYWLFTLFVILVAVAYTLLNAVLGGGNGRPNLLLAVPYVIFILACFIPSLAVAFRRLHDTDRSAWWLLIGLIPLIGSIVLLVFYCLPGTPGPNRFDSAPGAATEDLQDTFD